MFGVWQHALSQDQVVLRKCGHRAALRCCRKRPRAAVHESIGLPELYGKPSPDERTVAIAFKSIPGELSPEHAGLVHIPVNGQ